MAAQLGSIVKSLVLKWRWSKLIGFLSDQSSTPEEHRCTGDKEMKDML